MSALTIADVERIAALAHLDLTAEEKTRFARQLADILDYAQQLQAVDTDGVAPLSHPLAAHMQVALRLREDAPTEPNRRDDYQKVAPKTEDGLYLVPKVID